MFLSVSYRIEQCKYFNWDYSLLLYWVNPCWQSWHHLQTGSLSSHHNITYCPLIVSHQYTWLSLSWEEALSHVGSLHQHHDNNYGDKCKILCQIPSILPETDQISYWHGLKPETLPRLKTQNQCDSKVKIMQKICMNININILFMFFKYFLYSHNAC